MTDSSNTDNVKERKDLYKYMHSHTKNIGENRTTLEKVLYDNGEVLSIKLFKKSGDKLVKVTIKQTDKDIFGVRLKKNDDVTEKNMNMKDLKKYLSDNKDFSFASDYISKEMSDFREKLKGKQSGGAHCFEEAEPKKKSKKKKSKKKKSKKKVSRKKSRKKASRKKASRKKVSRKKASRKKASRKKASRKKVSRKKASRKKSRKY
jgi:hypothetical protein